jgi:hypothetical protein
LNFGQATFLQKIARKFCMENMMCEILRSFFSCQKEVKVEFLVLHFFLKKTWKCFHYKHSEITDKKIFFFHMCYWDYEITKSMRDRDRERQRGTKRERERDRQSEIDPTVRSRDLKSSSVVRKQTNRQTLVCNKKTYRSQ